MRQAVLCYQHLGGGCEGPGYFLHSHDRVCGAPPGVHLQRLRRMSLHVLAGAGLKVGASGGTARRPG